MSDPNQGQQEERDIASHASPPPSLTGLSVVKQVAQEAQQEVSEQEAEQEEKTSTSEKAFGELAPLARVVSQATRVLDEETRMVSARSPLSALRVIAQQKEALLTQHDLQILRLQGLATPVKIDHKTDDKTDDKTGDLSAFVSKMDQGARTRLRALYSRFEKALRQNGLRLKAALASSEMLLAALSEAAQAEGDQGPQLYTSQGRLSETDSVSFSRSVASESEV